MNPLLLTETGTYSWHANHVYKFRFTDTTGSDDLHVYDLWRTDLTPEAWDRTDNLHAIAVNDRTDTWDDYGAATPNYVTENSDGTVSVSHDSVTDTKYKFIKPTSATWIGATSTGTTNSASGSLYRASDTVVEYTIDATSPTASNYSVTHHGVTLLSSISHSNGTVTPGTLLASTYALPKFFGTVALNHGATELASSLYVAPATPPASTPVAKKKVHCNFW